MNRKSLAAIACFSLATVAVMPSALADTWNKKTILTVNEPVQVPGALLQPGKYVMKLLDSPSNRHIVQIFNADETQLQTTILAIPNYRLQPTGKTEFQWWETPASQPRAMRAWFYPGDNFGQEFAYPKNTAVQIATYSNQNVPSVSQTENLEQAKVSTVDKTGEESELSKEAYQAPPAAPAPEVAQNRAPEPAPEAPAAAPAPDMTRARTELPKTASPFPMFGLAGFFALGTSVALRAIAKRSA
jgi:hypothetical protein